MNFWMFIWILVHGCQWVSIGTNNMIYVSASLDNYGTRARPRIRAAISIRVIHWYLDTHRYSRVSINFLFFFVQRKILFKLSTNFNF